MTSSSKSQKGKRPAYIRDSNGIAYYPGVDGNYYDVNNVMLQIVILNMILSGQQHPDYSAYEANGAAYMMIDPGSPAGSLGIDNSPAVDIGYSGHVDTSTTFDTGGSFSSGGDFGGGF